MNIYDISLNECTNKVTTGELINLFSTYPDNTFVTFVCKNVAAQRSLLCFKDMQFHTDQHEFDENADDAQFFVTVELEAIQDYRSHLPI